MLQIKNVLQKSTTAMAVTSAGLTNKSTESASIITLSPSEFITKTNSTFTKPLVTHTQTANALNTQNTTTITVNKQQHQQQQQTAVRKTFVKNATLSSRATGTQGTKMFTHNNTGTIRTAENSNSTDTKNQASTMEHSYLRDPVRLDVSNGLKQTRTVLLRRPPQCSLCHVHPYDENQLNINNNVNSPAYDEINAKESMNECPQIAKYVKNINTDDVDWVNKIDQLSWSAEQIKLFENVTRILDYDQLSRLAMESRPNEPLLRRVTIDKSSSRLRRALAAVAWEPRITQWLHALLMDHLPPSYMASYLDIMQTLKTKLPTLTDKMLFSRPLYASQELLAPIMKHQWEPKIIEKQRNLPHKAIIILLPCFLQSGKMPQRTQNWYKNLSTIAEIVTISLPNANNHIAHQNLEQVAEAIVCLTRAKIHDLRIEDPSRGVILLGINAGAALALQVAISESVACVICLGFAYNTLSGVRGSPDDRLLDIKAPILFVIGQNAARTSPEEMELLREKMQSESSLVIVGCADDVLRLPKSRRKIECVTQAMVDSMVTDEIFDFISSTFANPPGTRLPTLMGSTYYRSNNKVHLTPQRKRKQDSNEADNVVPAKSKIVPNIGRPRTRPLNPPVDTVAQTSPTKAAAQKVVQKSANINEEVSLSMQSLLNEDIDGNQINTQISTINTTIRNTPTITALQKPTIITGSTRMTTGAKPATLTGAKLKMLPTNQFVQVKTLPPQSKFYAIKSNQIAAPSAPTSIGSIVKTVATTTATGQQQIFTLKTPSGQVQQFITATPTQGAQQKYAVIKNANGTTTLQLTKTLASVGGNNNRNSTGSSTNFTNANIDLTNINDMPIIFADNEGNLPEQEIQLIGNDYNKPEQKIPTNLNLNKLQIIKKAPNPTVNTATGTVPNNLTTGKSVVLNKATNLLNTPNANGKIVYINRNAMKSCANIVASSTTAAGTNVPQYHKIIVKRSNMDDVMASNSNAAISGNNIVNNETTTAPIMKTVNLANLRNAAITSNQTAIATISAANAQPTIASTLRNANILNLGNRIQIANTGSVGDKTQIRNIVLKPGTFKTLPAHLSSQLLNRNLTVRKVLVPTTKTTALGLNTMSNSVTITPKVVASQAVTTATNFGITRQQQPIITNALQNDDVVVANANKIECKTMDSNAVDTIGNVIKDNTNIIGNITSTAVQGKALETTTITAVTTVATTTTTPAAVAAVTTTNATD